MDQIMIIELNDYQQKAIATMRPGMSKKDQDIYCSLKLSEECGEIVSIIAKHYYHDKEFRKDDLLGELSDLFWYLATLAHNNNFTLSEIATFNIDKLQKRHGNKYNEGHYRKSSQD